ncbi:MAG: tetratricopeptide repeat protein [Marinobacter sp.]|nr:tetratricopeptide repeat protein [Marinobacter sp.]
MKTGNTSSAVSRIVLALTLTLPLLAGCNNQPDDSEAASHINRAETYADQGQYRSALLEVKNAIQMQPDNVDYIVQLAELYLDIGANKQASELLEPWLKDFPDTVALPLARAYVNQGKHLSATETLALHKPASPEEQLEADLIRAEALRRSGQLAEAQALYQNLATSNPSNVAAISGLLNTQINLNQNATAVQTADDWLSKQGTNVEVLYWKGIAQYRQNNLDAAADTLTNAVGEVPSSDVFLPVRRDVLSALSRVLTEQGRITEAQVYNKILAENMNTEARAQAEAAIAAIKDGKIDEAKSILRDMLKLNPDNQSAALILGTLEAGSGELDEGAQLLTENLDPETTPTQFIRAATMAQIDKGQREEALKTLSRAIEARPDDNELLAMHGILALSLPEHAKEGITSLSKVLANEPDRVRLRLALARHYIGVDQPEQALAQLRMAFTSNPADWATTGTYLNLLIQQGEKKEAAEIRDSLLNGYADEPQAILLASMADARLGNVDNAVTRLAKLVDQKPELQAPMVALATLYAQTGKTSQAVDLLVKAALITPNAIQPLQQAGQLYARDHDMNQVKAWLGKVADAHPPLKTNADILQALINIRQGNLADARKLLDRHSDPDSAPLKRANGRLLVAEARAAANAKNWEEARGKAAEAIALEPENLGFALLPVGLLQMQEKYDDALKALDGVETSFGNQPAVILSRATLLQAKDGKDEAYKYLLDQWKATKNTRLMPSLVGVARATSPSDLDMLTSEWLSATPESPAAHMARAEWLMNQQQNVAAKAQYEEVLKRQPNNAKALNNLAWMLREDDLEKAGEYAQKASKLEPKNPAILDTYGWILHLQGDHQNAQKYIEQALALAPGNADIEAHLDTVKQAM